MKHIFYLFFFIFITSCGNKKIVQLAEISNSDINEILDVSPAYIFYDETKSDSLELNRKNLISTTNWLVNVDKRLTLKQVIPQITFLQNKKKNSSHKKDGVKNYYTCNDTSIKNLGFIDFTDVVYLSYPSERKDYIKITDSTSISTLITFDSLELIEILQSDGYDSTIIETNWKQFEKDYKKFEFSLIYNVLNLSFNKNLSFQEYITFKSLLLKMKKEGVLTSNNEFIY